MASVPITRAGKEKLRAELDDLERRLPDLRRQIAEAREKGDLRENAEYHAAREDLGMLQARIAEIKERLLASVELSAGDIDRSRISFGATVRLRDLSDDSEDEWFLVGPGEDDPLDNRILTTSPLGQCLVGHQADEEVAFEAPAGTRRFKILSFRYDDG